ncbi:hypothetical protein BC936DRAFT_143401 [Jimgerdemannia flammicorona]|uniref:SET domain-containing protein n=1 Tax=Jimgerdemannia flammicorona TaxID=994334 RepID=A0A433DDW9_9FUNG|nr:hypothetical protein BC936DRAFT_143401 [Jimgerdemannia flammicorona]
MASSLKDIHAEHARIKNTHYNEKSKSFEADYQRNASVIDVRVRKRKAQSFTRGVELPAHSHNEPEDTSTEPLAGITRAVKRPRAVSKFRMGDLKVRLPATEMLPRHEIPYRQPPPKYPYWTHLKRNIMTEDQPDLEFHPYFEQANDNNNSDSDDDEHDKASYLDYFNDLATVITDPDSEDIHFQVMEIIFRRYKIPVDIVHDYRSNLRRIKERDERERSTESHTSSSSDSGEDDKNDEQEQNRAKAEGISARSISVCKAPSYTTLSVIMESLHGYLDEDVLKLLDIRSLKFQLTVDNYLIIDAFSFVRYIHHMPFLSATIFCVQDTARKQGNLLFRLKCQATVQRAPVELQVIEKLQRGRVWTEEEQHSFEQGRKLYGRDALCEVAKFIGDNMTCYEIWLHLGRPQIADLAAPGPDDEDDRLDVINDGSEDRNSRCSTPRAAEDAKQHELIITNNQHIGLVSTRDDLAAKATRIVIVIKENCSARNIVDVINNANGVLSDVVANQIAPRNPAIRTRVGVSTIPQAGWGLFATEDVARGELVGEYVGEIITDGEVERRGAIYDKGGGDGYLNCIFDLNRDYAVDATRMGNKIRFINHDALNPNCAPQVKMVNGEHRIGLYAIRDIKPGDELFFNYGKSGEAVKFVAVERKGE